MKCRAGRSAWSFERKLEERNGSELTRECWEKVKKIFIEGRQAQNRKGKGKDFFVERELRIEEVEKRREEGRICEPEKKRVAKVKKMGKDKSRGLINGTK